MLPLDQVLQWTVEYRIEICGILFAAYLSVLSVMDIRRRKLYVPFLLSGILVPVLNYLILLTAVLRDPGTKAEELLSVWYLLSGAVPGIVLLTVSALTKESFGYGDSIVIFIMGILKGFWDTIWILMAAFSLSAVFAVFLLAGRKFHRKSSFPFVPFLTAAYIGGIIIERYR